MLNCLVFAEGTVEPVALFRISRGSREPDLAEPDRFSGDQDALRIHAVQDVFEAATFLAQAILKRYFKILDEEFVGVDGLAAHLLDFMHSNAVAVEVSVKQA